MNIDRFDTIYKYAENDRRVRELDLLILHYTASPYSKAHGGSNPKRIKRWMQGKGRKSSTHFTVLRNGDVLQCASLKERTWHSGGSRLIDPNGKELKSINFRSIGLDFDNVGNLYKHSNGFIDSYERSRLKSNPGSKPRYYEGPTPYVAEDGSYWEPYSIESIESMARVLHSIAKEYPIFKDESWRLVGHETIRSTKSDPGPACPLEYLRSSLVEDYSFLNR